jgi:predicted enzyme related to lactoylglutathione lyase
MANRICFVELPAAKIGAAKSFYADAFGVDAFTFATRPAMSSPPCRRTLERYYLSLFVIFTYLTLK